MRICGIKLTHDGAVAVIENGKLAFCVELEKRDNNFRYIAINDLGTVAAILTEQGFAVEDVDEFVIDGWDGEQASEFRVFSESAPIHLRAAPYKEVRGDAVFAPLAGSGLMLGGRSFPYTSFPHVSGHIAAAYCTSPFVRRGQPALCLVWDGGITPRLYHVDGRGARHVGDLFPLIGHIYAAAGHHFGPYKKERGAEWDLGVAGKLMAYIALGTVSENVIAIFRTSYGQRFAGDTAIARTYREHLRDADRSLDAVRDFFDATAPMLQDHPPQDVLASFHVFVERLLVREMTSFVERHSFPGRENLCIAGGCGLNIKWNSALRESGLFREIWVPPFPNDSGAAIGAACCALGATEGLLPLDWSVYAGPAVKPKPLPAGWTASPCSLAELAKVIADNKPVVFLAGRAELGPRALGGRSILASAMLPSMRDHLNDVKLRERFRPVAPICLEDRASTIFSPGTPDRYMLFEHQVRPEWRSLVPAVMHLDGSARLQTISRTAEHPVAALLVEYEKLTGIPLLCNTSANHHGRGFFPDAASACVWGRVEHVWCEGMLATNPSRASGASAMNESVAPAYLSEGASCSG